jgi:UDP-N-acetylglucosamine--N-acetylmuramyl-(pentapeptide) pyrophosphoryl-undecaprenol N-acetylglucosamine transferase
MSIGRIHSLALQMAAPQGTATDGPASGSCAAAGTRPVRAVIAGGGTGGHLFPGIAIAEEICGRHPESRVLFISRGSEFERRVLDRAGFPLEAVAAEGLKGRGLWRQARALGRIPGGIRQAGLRIDAFGPDLVIGLGSYAAAPVVLAAWRRRIPIVLCEQNTLPGLANRLLARAARRIYTAFERTERFDPRKVLWTGNPLRREIARAAAERPGRPPAASCEERFTVLIIGGSQGAHSINRAAAAALGELKALERLFFVHQTGPADEPWVREAYREAGVAARVQDFFDDMAEQYRKADLVVCRAGATTIAEVMALGKAAVFIPFPHAADDHQRLNARRLAEEGAADWIDENELTGERLGRRILQYATDPAALRAMADRALGLGRPDAAERIVDDCLRIVARRRRKGRRADGPSD